MAAISTTGSATNNSSTYTGRESDSTGLMFYRARYYSPGMGRFLSQDPAGFAGGSLNLYQYVGGDPTSYYDPLGLARKEANNPCANSTLAAAGYN